MKNVIARIAASPSKSLLAILSAFLAGIAAHAVCERAWFSPVVFLVPTAAALLAAFLLRRRSAARLLALCVGAVCLALWRYDAAIPVRAPDADPPSGEAAFQGAVVDEPRHGASGTTVIVQTDGARAGLRVRVPFDAAAGERIAWRCRMRARAPDIRERFHPDVAWSCESREAPTAVAPAPPVRAALHAFRARVREAVAASVPEPEASLALGLLIGDDAGLPRKTAQAFRDTGTAHVLAVSGYNVRLLVDALFVLFAACAVRRPKASGAVALLVIAFATTTGGDAPVVRAAFMGSAAIVAGLLGRRDAGIAPLLLAAATMLAAYPSALHHDVGFRLSFAAVAGMRMFGPRIFRWLGGDPDDAGVRRSLADTLAATAATLPITLHDFGTLPLAAPLVNVAIAPMVPPLMIAASVTAALGAVSPALGALPGAVCAALGRALVAIVTTVASAAPPLPMRLSAPLAVLASAAMVAIVFFPRRRSRFAPPDALIVTHDAH